MSTGNESAIKLLLNKKAELESQRQRSLESFDREIRELETAMELLSGKKVWEIEPVVRYDDEKPDYITGTEDGI